MNLFDYIKVIYKKTPIELDSSYTTGISIALAKWLNYDEDNIIELEKLVKYIFWIEPKHFFYLLYCNIRYKKYPPFLHKFSEKKEIEQDEVYEYLRRYLRWTPRELQFHLPVLDRVINHDYWKKEFGIK